MSNDILAKKKSIIWATHPFTGFCLPLHLLHPVFVVLNDFDVIWFCIFDGNKTELNLYDCVCLIQATTYHKPTVGEHKLLKKMVKNTNIFHSFAIFIFLFQLQLLSMADGHFVQEDFQSTISSATEGDVNNWTHIDFAAQAKKSRTTNVDNELIKDSPATQKSTAKAIKKVASKRKQMTMSGPKVKKFKGQGKKGIIRANGK